LTLIPVSAVKFALVSDWTVTISGLATVATLSVTPLFFGNGMVVEEAAV